MMQHTLQIPYGDDVLLSSGLNRKAFDEEARFLLAAKLYELGRLSSGQAATLCGKERVPFLMELPKAGISVSNLGAEDADSELDFIQNG
jgi:predicted HTH domain antitoxin